MPIKAQIITLDANGKVVLTPLEAGTIYTPGWRWFEWRGQLWLAKRIDRMGNMMDPEPVSSEGLPTEIDIETGNAFMVLSPGPDKPGAEELQIPAVKHTFRVSSLDEGPGLRWWYTAEIGGIQLLGAESWYQIDVEYALRLEHLATQAELVLAERAEQERRREAQEAAEREENRAIQLAVVSVTASDLIRFVKCWPHLRCRKPNVNRVEMERIVRRWARAKKLNLFKAVAAAEPFYQNWRDELLEQRKISVEEVPTIPPQDVNLVEDFGIPFQFPGVSVLPLEPKSYLGDLEPDYSNNMEFGPPVEIDSSARSLFLTPIPTAVVPAVNSPVLGDLRLQELQLKLVSPRIQESLGLNSESALFVIAVLRANGEITPDLKNSFGENFDIERLIRFVDDHRGEEPEIGLETG